MHSQYVNKRKILLVAYGGGHVALLAPVALKLQADNQSFVFLALTTAASYLDRMGLPHIGYRQLPGANDPDVLKYGQHLMRDLPGGGSVSPDETVAYLGLNYRELVREFGEEGAASRYAERGRQSFLPTGLFERWLGELQPSVVVATNSPRSEQAALLAAGRLGIPSLCAVDIFGLQEVKWIGQPAYADRVCVLNAQVREMFLDHGRWPEEVVVTGNPAFERLQFDDVRQAGKLLRETRGWSDGKRTILWASQIEPEQHPFAARKGDPALPRCIESALRDFVAQHSEFRLVVRYHPSERVSFNAGQADVEFSPTSEDLATLLHAVDIVVVTASTVGLEASLAGRPVISVDASVFTDDAPYSQMGISIGVPDASALAAALLELSSDQSAPFYGKQSFSVDESPTQKITKVIYQLMA